MVNPCGQSPSIHLLQPTPPISLPHFPTRSPSYTQWAPTYSHSNSTRGPNLAAPSACFSTFYFSFSAACFLACLLRSNEKICQTDTAYTPRRAPSPTMPEDDASPPPLLLSRQGDQDIGIGTDNGANDNMTSNTKTAGNREPAPTHSNEGIGDSDERIIEFDKNNLDTDKSSHVFETSEDMGDDQKVAFKWEVIGDGIQLKTIELIKVEDPNNPVRTLDFPQEGITGPPGGLGNDVFESFNNPKGSTNLNLGAFRNDVEELEFDDVYAVMLTWSQEGSSNEGKSVSPYFTVMNGNDEGKAAELQGKVLAFDDAEDGTEDDGSGSGQGRIRPDTTNQSNNPNDVSETDAAGTDDSNDGGGGGLSPGVIAGIVVGVVVFLALVGGLVFFLLRRRRKAKRAAGYADAGQNDASNAYIVDKLDTTAQSPRSPYSDDGHEQHTPLDPHAHHNFNNQEATAPGEGSNGSEYAGLYQANQQQQQQDASRGVGDEGVQSSPRMQSRSNTGNYSHLVEEGMTAEDIRRLEEEERQLDAEIERHGRR